MDAEDGDAGDYDKTFLEEPAILDKYKAAAEVCESKSTFHDRLYHTVRLCVRIFSTWMSKRRTLASTTLLLLMIVVFYLLSF